ncbi:MAG: hypothetical protein JWP91_1174 [Fibrobacteres bacterium]|nr:hypothetical protein [Fibrobacterota bacterium]
MSSIFEYLDYRLFLKDAYLEGKRRNAHHSQRFIEGKLGLKSSGHFAQILGGRCNISPSLAARIAAFLKLGKREADFFETLVRYNQAKTHDEKNRLFSRIMTFRKAKQNVVGIDRHAFYRKWYYTAVREALDLKPFRGDHAALGRMLTPPISADQAKEAVDLLLRLGFVRKRPGGGLAKAEDVITSGHPAESEDLKAFQVEILGLAREAMDRFPKAQRNFSTLSVTLSAGEYKLLIEELRAFRGRVLEMARQCRAPDRVYQCNFQFFPLAMASGETA